MQPTFDVWKVIEICVGVAGVLLIPLVGFQIQMWYSGKVNAQGLKDVKTDVARLETKIDALTSQVSHMAGMLQGKWGMGDSSGHGT